MAKYRVKTTSFINNFLHHEGAVVDYDGVPHDNLEPLDAEAEQASAARAGFNVDDLARQKVAAAGAQPDAVESAALLSAAAAAAEQAVAGGAAVAGLV